MEFGDRANPSMPWYGIRTRSNFELIATRSLESKGYRPYLPLYRREHRGPDGIARRERPLFPGYVFCRFAPSQGLTILKTPGVVYIVAFGKKLAPIPAIEIEAIGAVLAAGIGFEQVAICCEGQCVRVKRGPLKGVVGTLLKRKGDCRFVISVPILQRAISIEIDADSVEAVSSTQVPYSINPAEGAMRVGRQ